VSCQGRWVKLPQESRFNYCEVSPKNPLVTLQIHLFFKNYFNVGSDHAKILALHANGKILDLKNALE